MIHTYGIAASESVKRASMPPVAKHNLNQTKPKQPKRAAA
ncbi:hypothetical protein [Klebsiella pneumoniae]|nr:hypothetical protein [Klebsiella pneumoniae]WKG48732.1 hypothetical protein QYQ51_07000 [Klebsiella pneumoniae]WKH18792.1 hypothetical protein QYQ38_24475 [Klebsiella pneumoniae]